MVFYTAIEQVAHYYEAEPDIVDNVATSMGNSQAFTDPMHGFIKQKVGMSSLEKAKLKKYFTTLP